MSDICKFYYKKKLTDKQKEVKKNKVLSKLQKNINIDKLDKKAVKETFKILDEIYFDNQISERIEDMEAKLSFDVSNRLSCTAGYCEYSWKSDYYGNKKITVSTSGIANKIKEAAKDIGTYLALSLHAPNDKLREKIMPINKKFKIESLIEQLKYYTSVVKEPIFLEYVMLKGINDTEECAQQLTKLMSQFPSKVNLIEFNSWSGVKFEPTDRKDIEKFSQYIQKKGYMSFIRRSRGDDVLAACGQLKTDSERRVKSN